MFTGAAVVVVVGSQHVSSAFVLCDDAVLDLMLGM